MVIKYHPYVEDRPCFTSLFAHGWPMLLMPADGVQAFTNVAHDVLKAHRFRIAFTFREMVALA